MRGIAAVAAWTIATSVSAYAADAVGTIERTDAQANAITLNDGTTYFLPATISTRSMRLGERVKVSYVVAGSRRVVFRIERAD